MAISVTSLTSGGSTTDGTSFTTASISPSANKTVLVAIASRAGTAPTSVTGNSLTYTKEFETADGLLSYWRSSIGTGTAGTITITFGASQTACVWSVFELDGDDTSAPIVQEVEGSGNATSGSITLASFSSAENATLGIFSHNANEATTPGTGFTEIHDQAQLNSSISIQTEFRSDNDTSVDASWVTSSLWRGIAVELKSAAAGSNGFFLFF